MMDDIEAVGRFISSVGFPVVVSCYLLWRFSQVIENLSAQVSRLATIIDLKLGGHEHVSS